MKLKVTVNGEAYDIDVEVEEPDAPRLGAIVIGGTHGTAAPLAPTTASVSGASANAVTAPLAGSVARVLVEEGQEIKAGEVLLVLEAMKMETEITAPRDGVVSRVLVEKGTAVQAGEGLVELD
ncbi:MAG: biotin/lipoyl-binding protein [Propionibacteriaceae bacterium]|jgi:methylmalonyl-CoA carboxyltransferase small subunit|nr:biotin/lipoyl-binding protein [Propionibacteriaceae bacterium]